MPAKVWPKTRVLFHILACLFFALTLLGVVVTFLHKRSAALP
jgi:hypothetical protein